MKNIAVYCSSSDALSETFNQSAKKTGMLIANSGWGLVYGGAHVGLMGIVADAVRESGMPVIGVIPEAIAKEKIVDDKCSELIVAKNLHERKQTMFDRCDGFIALAGGFGTIEEIVEVLTLKQLHLHNKPIVFVNTENFYDHLIAQFEVMYKVNVAKPDYRIMYHIAATPDDAIEYLQTYKPTELPKKWFKQGENSSK